MQILSVPFWVSLLSMPLSPSPRSRHWAFWTPVGAHMPSAHDHSSDLYHYRWILSFKTLCKCNNFVCSCLVQHYVSVICVACSSSSFFLCSSSPLDDYHNVGIHSVDGNFGCFHGWLWLLWIKLLRTLLYLCQWTCIPISVNIFWHILCFHTM